MIKREREVDIENKPIQDKTLFVCVNNVGRSQMAEKFYNEIIPEGADSAGINVDQPDSRVADWRGGADIICQAMDEKGLSIADNIRTQYNESAARHYSQVVYMLEPEQIPDDLDMHVPNRLFWPIDDPRDKPLEEVCKLRDNIASNVGLLATGRLIEYSPV